MISIRLGIARCCAWAQLNRLSLGRFVSVLSKSGLSVLLVGSAFAFALSLFVAAMGAASGSGIDVRAAFYGYFPSGSAIHFENLFPGDGADFEAVLVFWLLPFAA